MKPLFQQITILLVLVFFISACADKKEKQVNVPKVLLSEQRMAEILSETQLVEAYLNQIPYSKRGNNDSDYVYFPVVFEKYGIDKAIFLENLAYYSEDTEKIGAIYDKSIILLNKLKAKDLEIRLQMKMDSIYQDSINRALLELKQDSLKRLNKKTK